MSRVPRHLSLALALAVLAVPGHAAVQDVKELFDEAVDLLSRGRKEEALAAFQRVLAADPSNEEVYELWMSADREVMVRLLVEQGEYEQVAMRFLERSRLGRLELARDEAKIDELVAQYLATSDSVERRQHLNALRANHGEFAVPRLVEALADEANDDPRIYAMVGLTQMGADVVLPLVEALQSDDAFQRRNVAITLGNIGDPRAAGMLLWIAATDEDLTVQGVAAEAAAKCNAAGKRAHDVFLLQGDEYHHRRATVLREIDYSDVVWSWQDGGLVARDVPRSIYNNELAKRCYYRALAAQPDSLDALAGIARETIDIHGKLEAVAAAGEDVEALLEKAAEGSLVVAAAGAEALDRALSWSVQSDDVATGARICRALGKVAVRPTAGLESALSSGSAGLAGEAAVALAHVAASTGSAASDAVVAALGEAAGREVMRIVYLIDGDLTRARAMTDALSRSGVLVQHVGTGALGVATLSQLPGVDAVLVADTLPDITADAVIVGIRENASFGETPVFLISSNEELVSAFGDRIQGSLAGAEGIEALDAVFEANLTGDRAQADELAGRAAEALAALARGGRTNLGPATSRLAEAAARRDGVAIPALTALAHVGGAAEAAAALAVVGDSERSDEARIAAADALGGIASRASLSPDATEGLRAVVASDASLAVRTAAARALGRSSLGRPDRAGIIESMRVDVNID